jgi:nucleotide-binding universal stress UspA family protein
MFERILYAAELGDGKPPSFDYVRDFALNHNSEVIVLRVGEIQEDRLALAKKLQPDIEGASATAKTDARMEAQFASVDVAEALRGAGVFARTVSRTGRIAEEILNAADEEEAELIIVGSAPLSALRAFLTGDVTNEIVRRARRPVLIVPHSPPDSGEEGPPSE